MHPVDQTRLLTATMSPGRVGRLVARARRSSGLSERRFAEAVGTVAYTVRLWEMGDVMPTDVELNAIARVCGLRVDELLTAPDPVAIDFDRQVLRVATAETTLATTDNDEVLNAYVWLVRQQRSLKPGEPLRLRAEDLDILATQLDLEDADLEARLTRITGVDHEDAAGIVRALISRRVTLPVAGVLGSIGLFGAPTSAAATQPVPAPPPAAVAQAPAPTPTILDAPLVAPAPAPTVAAPLAEPVVPAQVTPPAAEPEPLAEPVAALAPPAALPTAVAALASEPEIVAFDPFSPPAGRPSPTPFAAPSDAPAPAPTFAAQIPAAPAPITPPIVPAPMPPPPPSANGSTSPHLMPPPPGAAPLASPMPPLPLPERASPAPVLAPPLAFTRSLPPPPPVDG